MAAWATAYDVIGRWVGDDCPSDESKVTTLIHDAQIVVASEYDGLQAKIDLDADLADRVRLVVSRMVIRHLRNPSGFRQVNEQTGPYGLGGTFTGRDPGGMSLTDEDRALLASAGGRTGSKVFSISTMPEQVDPFAWMLEP